MSYQDSFVTYLHTQFAVRKSKNKRYSFRAFSRDLQIDQSLLSKFLNKKVELSPQLILKCLSNCGADEVFKKKLENEIEKIHKVPEEVNNETLTFFTNWRFWALIEYFKFESKIDVDSISRKMNISREETQSMIQLLENNGFIRVEQESAYLNRPNNSWISFDSTCIARQKLQESFIRLSIDALLEKDFNSRWHSSLTIAINKKNLPKLKEMLASMQEDFGEKAQKSSDLNSVYQFTLSFFPLIEEQE